MAFQASKTVRNKLLYKSPVCDNSIITTGKKRTKTWPKGILRPNENARFEHLKWFMGKSMQRQLSHLIKDTSLFPDCTGGWTNRPSKFLFGSLVRLDGPKKEYQEKVHEEGERDMPTAAQ